MPVEITMPQLSDTMTEGTLVKWLKKEGEAVKAGEEIAEVETDKAIMPYEAPVGGVLAHVAIPAGAKVPVGALIAVIAVKNEDAVAVKKQFAVGAASAASAKPQATAAPVAVAATATPAQAAPAVSKPAAPATASSPVAPSLAVSRPASTGNYHFDIIVIGGGPAGYAAAIRAAQLNQRVLCVEKENLGGTCLNWGCIPTKALLEDGAFIRHLRNAAPEHGVTIGDVKIDFSKIIGRSRTIASKLQKGIGSLFHKYKVKHELGMGQILGAHKVRVTAADKSTKEFTAEHVVIAVGAKPTELPFAKFDYQTIVTSREAMTLATQPKKMAIIGAGAIGCEFADFYNAIGTEVTIVEMLPHLLPNEDEDVSILLKRLFEKRGVKCFTKTRTDKIEKTASGVKLTLSGENPGEIEADVVLVAVGVVANTDGLGAAEAKLELDRGRVKVNHEYQTNLENVWAVGDCIAMHWPAEMGMAGYRHPDLAHVAHHEAVHVIEHLLGKHTHGIDYRNIPGCTYTHPQVASLGSTEKKLREEKREIRIGKFPFSASGRALAAGEPDGFVKLIFDAKYGELLGAHMIGENVTEMLAELVLAKKLEATEAEIIDAMHPHPTMSEAIMEAAGVSDGRAIHL